MELELNESELNEITFISEVTLSETDVNYQSEDMSCGCAGFSWCDGSCDGGCDGACKNDCPGSCEGDASHGR